jgi:dGTPase
MREDLPVPAAAALKGLNERIHEPSKSPRWRSQTARDHDRLLYSSAFQRLGGITQVTASETGQPFHTRLTHSLKVAQVARRSAERLKQQEKEGAFSGAALAVVQALDADATDSAALAHDIGHPPFGHLAEKVLNERASKVGGFEGNAQSFRVVTRLALRNARPGLDLTRQTLNAMLKYPWLRKPEQRARKDKWGAYDSDQPAFDFVRKHSKDGRRSLEACLMDWADDVTYAVHDFDDFTRAGLIPTDLLVRDEEERVRLRKRLENEPEIPRSKDFSPNELMGALEEPLRHLDLAGPYQGTREQRITLRSFGSMLITQYVEAVGIESANSRKAQIVIKDTARRQVAALKALTMLYVVFRPPLALIQHGHSKVIADLWDWFWAASASGGDRRVLPPAYRARLADDDSPEARTRLVTDLIASMTESAALELHGRMGGYAGGTVLDAAARTL